jgi:protease I
VRVESPWRVAGPPGVVRGRRLTSWPSLKADLTNAGAKWSDNEVVVDESLVSSRKPQDIPGFNREMLAAFGKGAFAARPTDALRG